MKVHMIHEDLAVKYGINGAVVLDHIRNVIGYAKISNHLSEQSGCLDIDGKLWYPMTLDFCERWFPWLNKIEIDMVLTNLKRDGALIAIDNGGFLHGESALFRLP